MNSREEILLAVDGNGAVERSGLGTIVGQLAIVDFSLQTVVSDTPLNELVLNGCYTALTQANIDLVVTSVVVSPTGEQVVAILVLHNLCNGFNNIALYAQNLGAVDGEVNSCKGSFGSTVRIYSRLLFQTLAQLILEISNLAVGIVQVSNQSVALSIGVPVFRANGGNGNGWYLGGLRAPDFYPWPLRHR